MLEVPIINNYYLNRDLLDELFDSKRKEIAYKKMSMEDVYNFLQQLNLLLSSHEYVKDKSYFEAGRKSYLKEKIMEYLEKDSISENDIREALFHLMEIASNDYAGDYAGIVRELNIPLQEVLKRDEEYRNKRIVCLQEKDLLLNLSKLILKKIREVFLDLDYFFKRNNFEKVKDKHKRIVIKMNNENFYFPYETNVVYTIPNTDILFAITEGGGRLFFINKSFHAPVPEGFASPLRMAYPGLIPDVFSLSYNFNNPIKIMTSDRVELDISIEAM